MRISTGLRPRTELQRLPERSSDVHFYRDEVTPVVPVPSLKARDVWILSFQKVHFFSDGEMLEGDVMETMLSGTEPMIEKKSFKYVVTDEYPHKKEAEERYRWDNHIPEDANRRVTYFDGTLHSEVTLNWYEITIHTNGSEQ
jgi:hypothetical protein